MAIVPASHNLIADIHTILSYARQKAVTAVNFAMVEAYWLMGKRIVEEEQKGEARAQYGDSLIKLLSKALVAEFGAGFSVANLKNFRQFYLIFHGDEKGYTLCSLLSWSHYRLIMRVENTQAREYYIRECAEQNWSVRVLERNINTLYFQRLLSSQNDVIQSQSDTGTLAAPPPHSIQDFIKDPYIFEFLNIAEAHTANEQTIETALINQPNDNPTIGIILCSDKEETVVKYSVLNNSDQLFASEYSLYLPTEAELKQLLETDRILFELNQADEGGE
jgi:hypothetical protein